MKTKQDKTVDNDARLHPYYQERMNVWLEEIRRTKGYFDGYRVFRAMLREDFRLVRQLGRDYQGATLLEHFK